MQSSREQLQHKLGSADVKSLVEAGGRAVAKQEVAKHREKEDTRWQVRGWWRRGAGNESRRLAKGPPTCFSQSVIPPPFPSALSCRCGSVQFYAPLLFDYFHHCCPPPQVWLGQFSEALDRLVPRSDLDAMLLGTAKATLRDAEAAAERHARDAAAAVIATARTEAAALRIELDRRSDGLGERLGRAEDEVAAAREGLGVLAASLGAKAEAAAVEARVRQCETEIGRRVGKAELESELAKKLDVRVFLANSTSAAAAAAAAGVGGGGGGGGRGPSPSRRTSPTRPASAHAQQLLVQQLEGGAWGGAWGGVVMQAVEDSGALADEEASFSESMAAAARLAERVRARKASTAGAQSHT